MILGLYLINRNRFILDTLKKLVKLSILSGLSENDETRREKRLLIIEALSWAAGCILILAGVTILIVAVLTHMNFPKIIVPIITLLSVGAAFIGTQQWRDQLPNITSKIGFFASVALLPPGFLQLMLFAYS